MFVIFTGMFVYNPVSNIEVELFNKCTSVRVCMTEIVI